MEIKNIMTIYQEDKKCFWLKIAVILAVAVIAAFALGIYFALLEARVTGFELLHSNLLTIIRIKEWLLVFAVALVVLFAVFFYPKETCFYLFKYRFIIAGIALILCVGFEINGSSFGNWGIVVGGEADKPLIGINRFIRTDEWRVFTPMAISQYVNPMGSFSYFNPLLRATPTDYFIVYGQAVKDIAMIFRPFQIGYLFLNEGQGMAFFWCGRVIALFLVSFEFGRFLTKDQRVLSVVYATLLTFSPVVQWWFSVNGLVEMLVAGQMMIVLTDRYIDDHEAIWKKVCYSLGFFICAGIYAFTLYPSWEIPLAFIFFALFVWVIFTKRKAIHISVIDGLFLGVGALILVAISAHIIMQSWEAIQSVLHTAYPGDRLENGGEGFLSLFNYPLSTYFPIKENDLVNNVCEEAFLYDFFPLGILMACYVLYKKKKKDGLTIILLFLFLIFVSRLIVPWPAWLSTMTLLSKVLTRRLIMVVGWINLMLLIRGISLIRIEPDSQELLWPFILASVAFSFIIILISTFVQKDYASPFVWFFTFGILILGTLSICFYHRPYGKGLMIVSIFIICFFSGMMVNPINQGLDTVKDQTLFQDIKQTNQKDDVWIVEGMKDWRLFLNNYPIMAGAATINTTNTYPDMKRWRSITSEPKDEDIFNRYSHIDININPSIDFEATSPFPDSIAIEMNPSYLKKLKVSKILSGRDLTPLSTESVSFKQIGEDSGCYIFAVQYAK